MTRKKKKWPAGYTPEDERLFGLFHPGYGENRESSMHGFVVRLAGRKRYAIYAAPYSEWRTVADGRPHPDPRSFVVVARDSAARAVLKAARLSSFGLVLADGISWGRIGRRFRVNCLTHAREDAGLPLIEYARARIAAHQAPKASSLYGMT